MSNRKGKTDKTELVETHNIALALQRLTNAAGGYSSERWKRALYHALGMTETPGRAMLEKIRIALELP